MQEKKRINWLNLIYLKNMTKILKHCFVLWIVLLCLGKGTNEAAAQIILSPSVGCAPLSVQFSGPAGATGVQWNLSTGSSNLSSPSNLYSNPGSYNISYTAVVNGSPVSYSAQLKVHAPPTASFSYTLPSSHCKPMNVQFSGSGGAAGSTYQWAYGDLTSLGTGSNVSHTYNSAGSFTPVMIVTDAVTGCTAVAKSSAVVNVSDPANIIITGDPGLSACNSSLTTNISASLSTSGSPLGGGFSSVSWTFNVGSPASGSGTNPGPVTFLPGQHAINVSVTDNNNCTSTGMSYVSVVQPALSVTSKSVLCAGDSLEWNFNSTEPVVYITEANGTTHQVIPPAYPPIYLTPPGLHTFTVSAYPSAPCSAITKTFSVFVEQLTVTYVADTAISCTGSLALTYTANGTSNYSASILSYAWLAPSAGYNSSVVSPSTGAVVNFTFHHGPSKNPYTIYNTWNPMPGVVVTSQHGCTMNYGNDAFATLHRPTSWFYTDKVGGCSPLQVTFADSSRFLLPDFPIQSYTLYSGQGTQSLVTTSSTVFPVTFTYTAPGTYSAYMIVETAGGCIDTSFIQPIKAVITPTVSMTLAPSGSVCVGMPVTVNMSAAPTSSSIQYWQVETGSGFHGCLGERNPTSYFNQTGPQTFTLHAYQDGCDGMMVSDDTLVVRGPVGRVRIKKTCTPGQQRTMEFFVQLQDADNAVLDFGDNVTVNMTGSVNGVTSHSFVHTYTVSGDFTVTLTSNNGSSGCAPGVYTLVATPRVLVPRITTMNNVLLAGADTFAIGCDSSKVILSAANSEDYMTGCGRGAVWLLTSPGHIYQAHDTANMIFSDTLAAGEIYKLVLRIKDVNECIAFDTIHFRLSKATPDFSFSANPICLSSGSVQVINLSQKNQHRGDSIVNSIWDFGDFSGTVQAVPPLQNQVHWYGFAAAPFQQFSVSLIVENNVGCRDTLIKMLQVNNPIPGLQASSYFPCVRSNSFVNVQLSGISGYATYTFDPGVPLIPPTVGAQHSVNVPYYTPGVFVATLSVADAAQCKSRETITVEAVGQATPNIVIPSGMNSYCLPAVPVLVAQIDLYQTAYTNTLWTTGNNTTPAPGTATFNNHIFTTVGIHTVALTVNYNGYCSATANTVIVVADPQANLRVDKNRFCLGDTIRVGLRDTANVAGWQWFFGDFVPQPEIWLSPFLPAPSPTLSYPYTIIPGDSAGHAELALRYFGTMGACPRTATTNIQVIGVSTSFAENDDIYKHCLKRTDHFTASTPNPWGLQFNYLWDFGDQSTGLGQQISHLYQSPGTFKVLLKVTDTDVGCSDTAIRVMTVFPLPQASLSVNSDLICPGDTLLLEGLGQPGVAGQVTGTLTPATDFTFTAQNDFTVPVTAAATTTYVLKVRDENQCESDPATAVINVMPKPLPTIWDTSVVIGQTVQLHADQNSNFTYSWTPFTENLSCDTCAWPVSNTTVSATYSVLLTDAPLGCFTTEHIFRIKVIPNVSLDVPTAFTPNGDGVNDVIFPDGWGLHKLLYFRVYNRWGQLIFESKDLANGWDGRYNGEPQNMETYVYQVAVETLTNEVLTKSGSFKLLR